MEFNDFKKKDNLCNYPFCHFCGVGGYHLDRRNRHMGVCSRDHNESGGCGPDIFTWFTRHQYYWRCFSGEIRHEQCCKHRPGPIRYHCDIPHDLAAIDNWFECFHVILEALWLTTGNETYYRHLRYWSRIFIVVFGIGVASGIPLEIEFGANWSRFAMAGGDIMGSLLAVEASTAFALEAAFLAIFDFGWDRVGRRMHLFSNAMVALGASLSAFWIMSANSWMQTPAGVTVAGGKITVTNFAAAIFNPDLPIAFVHIWAAAIETTLFFVAGICAWNILRNRNKEFFLKAFKVMVIVGIVFTPLQIILGDASGLVAKNEPTKSAAMEAHWDTNPPGEGAAWVVIAWPDQAAQKNSWEITIPDGLSEYSVRSNRQGW